MTIRIPSEMVEQALSVTSVTSDSVNGVTDIENFIQQQKATSGWQVLPGGVILQWGQSPSLAANATSTITFPFTFPNQCTGFGYMPSHASGTYTFGYNTLTNSSFVIVAGQSNGAAASAKWFAIGY